MKFSIYGFNQEKLVQEYNTLNGNDLIVLRVLVDMLPRILHSRKRDDVFWSILYPKP